MTLSHDNLKMISQGNVALDVARILLQSTSVLATTDIASHAFEALEQSSIRFFFIELFDRDQIDLLLAF